LLALAPPRKNRYYNPPIREVGLGPTALCTAPRRDLPPPVLAQHHPPRGRKGRAIDAATERFVEATRAGAAP
jgi:hypothetical protein